MRDKALREDNRLLTDKEINQILFKDGYFTEQDEELTEGERKTFMALAKAQLAKADKARPADREKIKSLILEHKIKLPTDKELLTIEGFDKAVKIRAGEIADQILSLLNPEAIRREVAEEIKELEQALIDDASDLWRVTNAIKKEITSRDWILEGRGAYEWDDNRYKDETRLAFEAVLELIQQVQHPAQLRFKQSLKSRLGGE